MWWRQHIRLLLGISNAQRALFSSLRNRSCLHKSTSNPPAAAPLSKTPPPPPQSQQDAGHDTVAYDIIQHSRKRTEPNSLPANLREHIDKLLNYDVVASPKKDHVILQRPKWKKRTNWLLYCTRARAYEIQSGELIQVSEFKHQMATLFECWGFEIEVGSVYSPVTQILQKSIQLQLEDESSKMRIYMANMAAHGYPTLQVARQKALQNNAARGLVQQRPFQRKWMEAAWESNAANGFAKQRENMRKAVESNAANGFVKQKEFLRKGREAMLKAKIEQAREPYVDAATGETKYRYEKRDGKWVDIETGRTKKSIRQRWRYHAQKEVKTP